jgi:integral membrane sensor domain MASE1
MDFLLCARKKLSSSLPLRSLVVFFLYLIGDLISFIFSFPDRVSVFWIPNGIALAILIRSPYKDWGAYLFTSLLAYIAIVTYFDTFTLFPAIGLGLSNCLEIFLGAWFFRLCNPVPIILSDVKTMVRLILLSGAAGPAAAALIGAGSVVAIFGHNAFWQVWYTWFAGDGIGILLIAPCILAWTSPKTESYSTGRFIEIGLHLLSCVFASILIFGDIVNGIYTLPYFMTPLLLWAGLRFDLRITTLSLFLFGMISAWYTNSGHGPFAIRSQFLAPGVLRFQLFFGITLSTVLIVYAIISERKRIEREKETLIRSLEEALNEIKTLSGLLPICAQCKKIRDDDGNWKQLETYIQTHSDAQFSHGICPECSKVLYPDYIAKIR